MATAAFNITIKPSENSTGYTCTGDIEGLDVTKPKLSDFFTGLSPERFSDELKLEVMELVGRHHGVVEGQPIQLKATISK